MVFVCDMEVHCRTPLVLTYSGTFDGSGRIRMDLYSCIVNADSTEKWEAVVVLAFP